MGISKSSNWEEPDIRLEVINKITTNILTSRPLFYSQLLSWYDVCQKKSVADSRPLFCNQLLSWYHVCQKKSVTDSLSVLLISCTFIDVLHLLWTIV